MSTRIRVLSVEDHSIVQEGLALIINRQPDMEVVGAARTAEEAVDLFRRHRPDITLMDLRLGVTSGVDAIHAIRNEHPEARIIVLTMYHGEEDIHRALQAGAATYLLKETRSDDLIRVIREVHAGRQPMPPDVRATLDSFGAQPRLTPRELQVIELVSCGMRNKEIAASLGIHEETAEVHVKNIFSKLKVNDRTAAVRVAVHRGIIHLE